MEKKILWFLVIALLLVDFVFWKKNQSLQSHLLGLQGRGAEARLESIYAHEEYELLTRIESLARYEGFGTDSGQEYSSVHFFLITSTDDCTNCIESEISILNELQSLAPPGVFSGAKGFFVDEDERQTAERFIANLNPQPLFDFGVRDVLSQLPEATTPLVLVVRAGDSKLLDVYKPIPENYPKRDAFYARWKRILNLQ